VAAVILVDKRWKVTLDYYAKGGPVWTCPEHPDLAEILNRCTDYIRRWGVIELGPAEPHPEEALARYMAEDDDTDLVSVDPAPEGNSIEGVIY